MVYKANPVPNFYYEPPPPKPEPKKVWSETPFACNSRWKMSHAYTWIHWWQLPVTRPKSPKFNVSRRKSLSDAVNSPQEEKGKSGARTQRHSYGGAKTESSFSSGSKVRSQQARRSSNGSLKPRERVKKEPETQTTVAPNLTEQTNSDIAVQS